MMICLTTSVGAWRLEKAHLVSCTVAPQTHTIGKTGRGNLLDEALVDAHLVGVPGLGTLTVRGLTGGDLEVLGRETDGSLDAEGLGLGTLNQLGADLLERSDLARGESDTYSHYEFSF